MTLRKVLGWTALALAGLALAAGVSIAASNLSSQRIGLASEPASAGDELTPARFRAAPAPHKAHRHRKHRRRHAGSAPTTSTQPSVTRSVPATPPPQLTGPRTRSRSPDGADDSNGSSDSGSSDSGDSSSGSHGSSGDD